MGFLWRDRLAFQAFYHLFGRAGSPLGTWDRSFLGRAASSSPTREQTWSPALGAPATGPPGQSQSTCFLKGPRAARARSLKGPPTSTGSWGARRASCCSRGLKGPCRSPLGAPTRKFSVSHTGPGVQACNEMLGPGGRRVLGAQGLRDLGLSHPAAGPGSLHRLPPVRAQSRIEDTQQTRDER